MEKDNKEKLKKMIVIGVLVLLFCGIVYMILKPKPQESNSENQSGINSDMPSATIEDLPNNKLDSYQRGNVTLEDDALKKEQAMETFSEYLDTKDSTLVNSVEPVTKDEWAIYEAMKAYEEADKETNSYYNDYVVDDEENYQLRLQLDEEEQKRMKLERELEAYKDLEAQEQRQMAMLEKSYELASKYNAPQNPQPVAPAEPKKGDRNLENISVVKTERHTVTTLHQQEQDTILLGRLISEPSNNSFNTAVGKQRPNDFYKNTIKAVVSETQVVKSGDNVKLQLLEDIRLANGLIVPRNRYLIARANLNGNRMNLVVQSVEVDGALAGVQLSAYDISGQEGIYIPDAPITDAVAEFTDGMANSLTTSTSVNINNTTAVEQVKGDLIRGAVKGAANLVNGKVKTYKVKINSGYRLYLYDTTRKEDK